MSGSKCITDNFVPNWLPFLTPEGEVPPDVSFDVECSICCLKTLAINQPADGEEVEDYTILPCGHAYGYDDIRLWVERGSEAPSCPICRYSLRHPGCGHNLSIRPLRVRDGDNLRDTVKACMAVGEGGQERAPLKPSCPRCLEHSSQRQRNSSLEYSSGDRDHYDHGHRFHGYNNYYRDLNPYYHGIERYYHGLGHDHHDHDHDHHDHDHHYHHDHNHHHHHDHDLGHHHHAHNVHYRHPGYRYHGDGVLFIIFPGLQASQPRSPASPPVSPRTNLEVPLYRRSRNGVRLGPPPPSPGFHRHDPPRSAPELRTARRQHRLYQRDNNATVEVVHGAFEESIVGQETQEPPRRHERDYNHDHDHDHDHRPHRSRSHHSHRSHRPRRH